VGPGVAETFRIRLLLGRDIGRREVWGGQRVAVVSRSWRASFFPKASPIGHRVPIGPRFVGETSCKIIGVVEDEMYDRLRRDAPPTVYLPFTVAGGCWRCCWRERDSSARRATPERWTDRPISSAVNNRGDISNERRPGTLLTSVTVTGC